MPPLSELLGDCPAIVAIREQVERISRQAGSRRHPPILIEGETGTGKGLLARLIHDSGPRAGRPFVDVNCAAIPETLLEAELFGFERGAFTDARQAKPGLFQLAHGGTIFLDEVGLLPEPLQAKLLKVIEERAVRRLGSTHSEPVDAVVLSATNEDLEVAIRERRFRADLYHRLAVLRLSLPPLRERGGDILLLADRLLASICADYGLPRHSFSPEARVALQRYPWPGNIRELRNVIERAALLAEAPVVTAAMLGLTTSGSAPAGASGPAATHRAETPSAPAPAESDTPGGERDRLDAALRESDWNISRAAARLGISRNTIRYRIEKYGLREGTPGPPRRERRPPEPAPAAEVATGTTATAATTAAPPTVVKPEPPARTVLRWELRRVTLLYARISGADTASSSTTSRMFEIMVEKVRSFGGRVEEVAASGIVAVFGLDPVEDAPRRAVKAAMAIQNAASRNEGDGAAITMAVHVVQALIGQVGGTAEIDRDAKRRALDVLDQVVMQLDSEGIFVTDAAAPFLERRFDLMATGGNLFRLIGPERAGLGLGTGGRMATFVGRQQELEFLTTRFESAARGHGHVVGIAGEAGIGKSRLLFELRQSPVLESARYLEAQCVSFGSAIPYLPVLDILRRLCFIGETDPADTVRARVRATLQDLGLSAEHTPYLLQVLDAGDTTAAIEHLPPEAAKARTFEAVRHLILTLSRRTPLVIAVEDLHWIDRTSEQFLVSLMEAVANAPILLVTTYRPGYRPPWIGRSYATQIALPPLAPPEGATVIRSLLAAAPPSDAVIDLIVSRAEGNPFFIEELVRALREQGGDASTLAVPDTVHEVLLARIDRLPATDRQLLQACAVIGKTVPLSLLRAVSRLAEDELLEALAHLRSAEFLYESAVGPEVSYVFPHVLTEEVAYRSLALGDRRLLHARIAEAMEALDASRYPEHLERLAHHCLHGEMWDRAVAPLRQAGHKTLARSANREGAWYFERALLALGHLPTTREHQQMAIDLRFDLRNALQPLGEFTALADCLREAAALAKTIGDQPRLGLAFAYLTDYWRLMGDHERATDAGQRALAIADAAGDTQVQVAARTWLGQIAYARGDYRQAMELFLRNLDVVRDRSHERFGLPQVPAVHSRTCLVWCLTELGEFEEGIAHGEEGIRIAESSDHALGRAVAYSGLGMLHVGRGDFPEGIARLERGIDLCEKADLPLWFPRIASSLGVAYALSGRLTDALPLLQRAVERATSMRLIAGHSLVVAALGYAMLLAGESAQAVELANRAVELARMHGERGHEAWALRLVTEAALASASSGGEQAKQAATEALALATELGMRPLMAHARVGLAHCLLRAGCTAEARDELTAARTLYEALGMRFWVHRVTAELDAVR